MIYVRRVKVSILEAKMRSGHVYIMPVGNALRLR